MFPRNLVRPGKSSIDPDVLESYWNSLNLLDDSFRQVVSDIRFGASLGCRGQARLLTVSKNAESAYKFGPQVSEAIRVWIKKGFTYGPVSKTELPSQAKIAGIMCVLRSQTAQFGSFWTSTPWRARVSILASTSQSFRPSCPLHLSGWACLTRPEGVAPLLRLIGLMPTAQLHYWRTLLQACSGQVPILNLSECVPPGVREFYTDAAGGSFSEQWHGLGAVGPGCWAYVPWPRGYHGGKWSVEGWQLGTLNWPLMIGSYIGMLHIKRKLKTAVLQRKYGQDSLRSKDRPQADPHWPLMF